MDNNVYYLSIDPSISSTGISVLSCQKDKYVLHYKTSLITKSNKTPDKTRFIKKSSLGDMFDFCLNHIQKDLGYKISFAIFEDYSYGSVGHLAHLGELNGIYKYILYKNKIEFDVIPPSSVKKIITGSGKATKEEVAKSLPLFLSNHAAFSFNNNDETDSVAVGIAYGENISKILRDVNNESPKDTNKNK